MLSINKIPRTFIFNHNNQTIELQDLNPHLPVEDIKELHSVAYPELINSSTINKGIKNDKITYEFQSIAGTKG